MSHAELKMTPKEIESTGDLLCSLNGSNVHDSIQKQKTANLLTVSLLASIAISPINSIPDLCTTTGIEALGQAPINIDFPSTQIESAASPIAISLQKIVQRLEKPIFSYSARIMEIKKNSLGDPISVVLNVSVQGEDVVIESPYRQFKFQPKQHMHIMIDGVERSNNVRQLEYRQRIPAQLSEEEEALIDKIAESFGPVC